jgi:UTP--glucose-1-phosphate uridylyltransferase
MLTKAVIPAAGLGTRMLPLTKGAPKEMLPVAGRPMIHHVVQEAVAAGIVEICIVIRNGKEAIRRYFEEDDPEVDQLDRAVEDLRNRCKIVFTYQAEPRGVGDAILCAKDFVGDKRFALLIPDQLFIGPATAISQLASKKVPSNAAVSSLICIPAWELEYFPGARTFVCESYADQSDMRVITGVEPADWAFFAPAMRGFGRTIYPPEVFCFLGAEFADPRTGEVDLLKTFRALLAEVPNYAVLLQGEAFDLGTIKGYQYFRGRFPSSSS